MTFSRTNSARPTSLLSLSVLAGVALVSATAFAAVKLYKLEPGKQTQTVGAYEIYGNDLLEPGAGQFQAVYQVSMWEKDGDPCKVQIRSRHLNTHSGRQATWNDDGECNANESTKKTMGYSDSETYIRGVNVCLNGRGDEIKGMRVYGAKLNRNTGALTNLSGSKSWSRPNCANWKTTRYCPAGQVVTGIVPSNKPSGAVSGFKLQCDKVVRK